MRRFVGIVTGICALYLTVGAGAAPCDKHSHGGSGESSVANQHHASDHDFTVQQPEQPKPCKSAAIPCCVAMNSCGATIALRLTESAGEFPLAAEFVPSFNPAEPLSRIAAPEPPPPKA